MEEISPRWSAIMSGIFIMIRHALKYNEVYGWLPNHHYLMSSLEISYEVADHVIASAALVLHEKPVIFNN